MIVIVGLPVLPATARQRPSVGRLVRDPASPGHASAPTVMNLSRPLHLPKDHRSMHLPSAPGRIVSAVPAAVLRPTGLLGIRANIA